MRKINFFIFFLILLYLCLFLQNAVAQKYSDMGGVFTPKGDLKVLVILAEFDGSEEYKKQDLPNWRNKSIEPELSLFYKDTTEFEKYKNDKNKGIISKFYYQMSLGKFRICGDFFSDESQNTVLISIDPENINSWYSANTAVLKELNKINPNFNFKDYDNRKNRPSSLDYYKSDNSNSEPDNILDFVVIMYKYNHGWKMQPAGKNNIKKLAGSQGGFSKLSHNINKNMSFGGTKISQDGFTLCNTSTMWSTFVHEINHELLTMPHYLNANSTTGNYFYKSTIGMGMMSGYYQTFRTALAFERWLLGWTEIEANGVNSDIKSQKDLLNGGIYKLRDFVTTGDAIRIKIPFPQNSNQFIWLENHQKITTFDEKTWKNKKIPLSLDPKGVIPENTKGIYIYTERMQATRKNMQISPYNMNLVNSIKIYNARGNFDYKKSQPKGNFWGHDLRVFSRIRANPISGTNPFFLFFADLNNDGKVKYYNNFNYGKNEGCFIALEEIGNDTLLTFNCFGGIREDFKDYIRSDAFKDYDILNMYSNPIITNIPRWSNTRGFEPIYLNGLQIAIIDKIFNDSLQANDFLVKVEFSRAKILKDVNWSGKVYLPNITNDTLADVIIMPKVEVRIAQNFTTTRTFPNKYNSFSDTSIFKVLESSKMKLRKKSKLTVESNCTLILENFSVLELDTNAKLILEPNSHLIVKKNAIMRIHNKAKIIRK